MVQGILSNADKGSSKQNCTVSSGSAHVEVTTREGWERLHSEVAVGGGVVDGEWGVRGKQRRFPWRTEALKPQKGIKYVLFHFSVPQRHKYRPGKWDLNKCLRKKMCFCFTVRSRQCSQSSLRFKHTSAAISVGLTRTQKKVPA